MYAAPEASADTLSRHFYFNKAQAVPMKITGDTVPKKYTDVSVMAGSSPEGGKDFNWRLAIRRARAAIKSLNLPAGIPVKVIGADWKGFSGLLLSKKEELPSPLLLKLAEDAGKPDFKAGKDAISLIGRKEIDKWLERNIYPELRHARVDFTVDVPGIKPEIKPEKTVVCPVTDTIGPTASEYTAVTVVTEEKSQDDGKRPFVIAVKTNLLYDAALIPNIGIEIPFAGAWSVAAQWQYAWWKSKKHNRFWQTYGGDIEVRRWFCGRYKDKIMAGHHVGVYGGIISYDFEWGKRGYQARPWSYVAGVSYGFSLPVSSRINFDFTLGVGYMGGKYREYLPIDGHYVWQVTKQRHYFGPTKLEVSLVWKIGLKRGWKKGGDK